MNLRSLVSLAVMLAMPLTGCVIVSRSPGDVTFLWSFQGQSCAMVPAVKNVKIIIPGQTLMNEGVFDCSTNGTAGIVLHDFHGGFYSYTIQGRDYNGTVLFTKDGSFTVDGSVTVNTDLAPVGGGTAYANLVWTFPPNTLSTNPTCEQAGVSTVLVSIDGADWISYKCSDGQTVSGVATPYLTAGNHTIVLSAVNAMNFEYYSKSSTLPLSNTPTLQQYDLDWAVGGATVKWTISNGSTVLTCAQAGVTTVNINFRDSNGDLVYGSAGDPESCTPGVVVYSYLKPGQYAVFIDAVGTGGKVYQSARTNPPMVNVVAGAFPDQTAGMPILIQ